MNARALMLEHNSDNGYVVIHNRIETVYPELVYVHFSKTDNDMFKLEVFSNKLSKYSYKINNEVLYNFLEDAKEGEKWGTTYTETRMMNYIKKWKDSYNNES